MTLTQSPSFGELLRHFRLASGLTQEDLAARAGLSTRGLSDLERGLRRAPHKETITLLVTALRLSPDDHARFAEAARRRPLAPDRTAAATAPLASELPELPLAPTALVGRDDDLLASARLIQRADVRLVTLTGPGGVGKTRLALALGHDLAPHFAGGVALVSLASLADPALVPGAIAKAVGLRNTPSRPIGEALLAHLQNRTMLLILDNLEHLPGAAPFVATLLASCPHLTILLTSRAPLHLRGEHEYPVPPLSLPASADNVDAAAVTLFVQRARAVNPAFALTGDNTAAVAAICRRLDGLPLAIELAAARTKILPPQALLRRLDRSLYVLTGGARDLPARQQTMRDTIAWSYDLLGAQERVLFRRLAVFARGCTIEAAEAVSGNVYDDIVDGLAALVDHSLLQQHTGSDGEPRFTMLETIRAYALEQLATTHEQESVRDAHALYYVKLSADAEPGLRGPAQQSWLERLDEEHDNFRMALQWIEQTRQLDSGLCLVGALWRFWEWRGYASEGRVWLDRMLAASKDAGQNLAPLRAKALAGAGALAWSQGDLDCAAELCREALDLYRACGERRGELVALNILGLVAKEQGDYGQARQMLDDSAALARLVGETRGLANALNNLGLVMGRMGLYGEAAELHEESLSLRRSMDDRQGIAISLSNLGGLARYHGDYRRAEELLAESLLLRRALGDKRNAAIALNNLGNVARDTGNTVRARQFYEESLSIQRELADKQSIASVLANLGQLCRDEGNSMQAWTLLHESLQLRREVGDKQGIADSLVMLGILAGADGDLIQARGYYHESLPLLAELGERILVVQCLCGLADVIAQQGNAMQAALLLGAEAALRAAAGLARAPVARPRYDALLAQLRSSLGADDFAAAWAGGQALSPTAALATALTLSGDQDVIKHLAGDSGFQAGEEGDAPSAHRPCGRRI